MGETKKDIRIRTIFETLGGTRLAKEVNKMKLGMTSFTQVQKKFGRSIAPNITQFKKLSKELAGEKQRQLEKFAGGVKNFSGIMRLSQKDFSKFSDINGKVNKGMKRQLTTTGKLGLNLRKLTSGFGRFKFELLGILFFGMALQRFFFGLIRPALEATGVFKLWSTILTILFLPVALKILNWTIKFMGILQRSEALQKFIRIITILGAILGGLLFFIGTFGLGIGSLILTFGPLIAIVISSIGAIFGFIASMAGSKIGIIALIAAFIGLAPAVSATGDEIKKNGGIFKIFSNLIGGAIQKVIGFLDQMWEKFLDFGPVQRFLEGIGLSQEAIEKLSNPIATLGEKIKGMWDGFLRRNPEIVKKMGKLGLKADEILEPWNNLGTIITAIIDTLIKKVGEFITGKLAELKTTLAELIPEETKKSFDEFTKSFGRFVDKIDVINLDNLAKIIDALASIIDFFANLRFDPGIKAELPHKKEGKTPLDVGEAFNEGFEFKLTELGLVIKDSIISGFNSIVGDNATDKIDRVSGG